VAWQPLHVRLGVEEEEPYDGIPGHLHGPLWNWVAEAFATFGTNQQTHMLRVSAMARLPLTPGGSDRDILKQMQSRSLGDEIRFLAVIDALHEDLHSSVGQRINRLINQLEQYLRLGNSTWAVAPDRKSIVSRVDPTATQMVAQAVAPHDAASDELAEAWRKAYGREPDPSDAWDHSIKAVEALLIPIVVPTQDKPHLGHVLGQLDRQDGHWQLLLTTQQGITPIETLVGMLRLIYPNPDRHPGPERRVPTLEEAQAAIHLAVTIVQWARSGAIKRIT
jgi:hypothetical protein